tara:strand:+ start:434 stop:2416 length:1983 start_codon:yes stop_codon:yes gene_type:complete
MYFLVIIYLLYNSFKTYFKVNNLIEQIKKENNKIDINVKKKYKNIKFIMIYRKGDNINESINSLLKLNKNIKIVIIGKNIKLKNSNIDVYRQDYSKDLVNKIVKNIHKTGDIIGVFRTNTLFNKNLFEKVINHYNNNDSNKLFILSNIDTSNIYLKKYNFYNQINDYANDPEYDYFTNLSDFNKNSILNNFLITKIINLNSIEYCFYGQMSYYNVCYLLTSYYFLYLYPSLILIEYLLQLVRQVIIIFSNTSHNQALEVDLFDIVIANFLAFLKQITPKINFGLKKRAIIKNDSYLTPELELINKIENGIYYQVKDTNLEVIHLYGSPYQKGYAHGELCKHHFIEMIKIMNTLYENIIPYNKEMKELKNKFGTTKECLLHIYDILKEYIKQEDIDEIKGISDGSGIDLNEIIAITIMPELFHQHCMLLTKLDGNDQVFLRTLDYFFSMNKHILKIYHNKDKNSFCELGIPGTIWTMTAVSEKLICIGETSGNIEQKSNLSGTPFYFYFKNILQNCRNIDESIKLINKIKRNNNIFIMISSLLENKCKLIESSIDTNVYDRTNFIEYLNKYTNKKIDRLRDDVIFEYTSAYEMNNLLVNYSDFSIDNIKTGILNLFRTGGNHVMIVNKKNELYIRFNNIDNPNSDRNIYLFNLKELFNKNQ